MRCWAIALLLAAGCSNTQFRPSEEDLQTILRQTLAMAKEKFGSNLCLDLEVDPADPPESDDFQWQEIEFGRNERASVRTLPSPRLASLPQNLVAGWTVALPGSRCTEILRLGSPDFLEIAGDEHRRLITVGVSVDRLCGDLCGEQWIAEFEKTGDGWTRSSDTLRPTGIMY